MKRRSGKRESAKKIQKNTSNSRTRSTSTVDVSQPSTSSTAATGAAPKKAADSSKHCKQTSEQPVVKKYLSPYLLDQKKSTTREPVELPDECVRRVMYFLPFGARQRVQAVCRQWWRIGREYEELAIGVEFYHLVLLTQSANPSRNVIIARSMCFHWVAFLRTLTRTRGKVERLSLVHGLTIEQFKSIEPFIDETLCCGVKHLEMEAHTRKELIYDIEEVAPETEFEVFEEDKDPQFVAAVCNTRRLPQLESLVLRGCMALNDATVKSLTEETLPHLCALEMDWTGPELMNSDRYVLAAEDETWEAFFNGLPSTLRHLKLNVHGNCRFLLYLRDRLARGPPLPHLTSLQLSIYSSREQNVKALPVICGLLPTHLTSLKIRFMTCTLDTPVDLRLKHLINLKTLHLKIDSKYDYKVVGLAISQMTKLQELEIEARSGWPHEGCLLEGKEEDMYSQIAKRTDLHTLWLPARSITAKALNLLNLPKLRHLGFYHHAISTSGGCLPQQSLIPALNSLVSRSPKLELLDLRHLWAPQDKGPQKHLTWELLTKMETALTESRSEVFKSHCKCLKGILSSEKLSKFCPYCVHMVPKLRVNIGRNCDTLDFNDTSAYDDSVCCHVRQEERRRSDIMDRAIWHTFKKSPYMKVTGIICRVGFGHFGTVEDDDDEDEESD